MTSGGRFEGVSGLGLEFDLLQRNIESFLGPLGEHALLDGKLIKGELTVGEVKSVPHGLGRPFRGFIVVRVTKVDGTPMTFDMVYESKSIDESLYLDLNPVGSSNLIVTVWVF
jgi:hypothetical protein